MTQTPREAAALKSYAGLESLAELHTQLKPVLDELETDRRRALWSYWGIVASLILATPVVFAVFFGAAWLPHFTNPEATGLLLFSGPVVWFFTASWIYRRKAQTRTGNYSRRYKEAVFNALCRRAFPGVQFSPGDGIPYHEFARTGLFLDVPSVYLSEDKLQGRVGRTDIRLAEITAERKKLKLDSDGLGTEYVRIFHGLFLIADFHKHFRSTIRVLPERQKNRTFPGEQLVHMEDPEFEAEFVVYGTDQVDARYVLSTSMLRRILELRLRWATDLRLAFLESHVYLTIAQDRNWFEPNLYRSAQDPHQIQQLADQVGLCLNLVEELNLNTRIWSKK
jgi:hypothetical protein